MKKSVVLTTTAASIGLATVLTLSAVAPSMAKSSSHSANNSAAAKTATGTGVAFGATQDARKFTSVNFTITNVPSTITDAATAAKLLVVKVAPLAADATAAPATPPVPTFSGKSGDARPDFTLGASGDVRGPGFGKGGHGPRGDHDGDGPKGAGAQGAWTPGTAPAAPLSGDARPVFGDNDGDGPKGPRGGHGPMGGHGPRGPQLTNLSLVNGVLTGTLQLPGAPVAGAQKFAVYLSIAADSSNGIAAQSATPVMVTVTTAADLTPSVTANTGNVTLAIVKQ